MGSNQYSLQLLLRIKELNIFKKYDNYKLMLFYLNGLLDQRPTKVTNCVFWLTFDL